MKLRIGFIFAAGAITLAGCVAAPSAALPTTAPAARPAVDALTTAPITHATMSLDDIEPKVILPLGKGSSTGEPPLEAVHLYAQAQAALLDHDRPAAIDLLQKAVALDPLSYELHLTLGRVYLTPTTEFSDRSIAMLEKAAELEPNHLDLQTDLGRQYLAKGDAAAALMHLRLALRTRQYAADGPAAAVAEFFLANVLQKEGDNQAALEIYRRLARHLKSNTFAMRSNEEVAPLLEHADAIDGEIADLLAHAGRYDEAIEAYAELVNLTPSNFELRSRLVRLLIISHHRDRALIAAEDAAVHFRADAESIALLNEACLAAGHNDGAAGALSRLHNARPTDHAILFALADVLRADKRNGDAEKVLATAAERDRDDFEILRRRVALALDVADRNRAARMLIHATATTPELTAEAAPLFSVLSRPSPNGRLRWTDIKAMDVPASDEPSKWFWVSRLAEAANRGDVAEDALNRALADSNIAFAPAMRDRFEKIWDRDEPGKWPSTLDLTLKASRLSDGSIVDELLAMALVRQSKFSDAATFFAKAMDDPARKNSPDLAIERADALRKTGDDAAADSLLWKVINDHPTLRDAYEDLYLASIRRKLENQADRVITAWLAADPHGVTVRRIQAIQSQRDGHEKAAETTLVRLFNEHSDDPEAVGALAGFYKLRHQTEKLIPLLQQHHEHEPANLAVSSALADALMAAQRSDEAHRVLHEANCTAGNDPDLLYSISGYYSKIGDKADSEDVLAQVLKLDPSHPGAANDLGYLWAESGRNLDKAETLIRQALAAEPHNISYLDSMGWILYKRGKFAESRGFLDRAIGKRESAENTRPADPVVLNHRGDTLYRLGDKQAATTDWQHAADQIAAMKDDADDEMKSLDKDLLEKLRRVKAGEAVNVSPVGDGRNDEESQIPSTKP